tara:strand:- start:181577 stop:182113 length:537 start_codon:yes stop_codon:yes gene_type:complete
MSDISFLNPDEQNLLSGSLYKTAIWMSHIDDEGSHDADEQERQALEAILKKSVRKFSAYPAIAEIAAEALRREKYWPQWEKESDSALDDVAQSIALLTARLVDDEVSAYKQLIMGVASSVAGAFDEGEDENEGGLWASLSGLVVGAANPKLKAEMNTSPAEDSALTALTQVLNAKKER